MTPLVPGGGSGGGVRRERQRLPAGDASGAADRAVAGGDSRVASPFEDTFDAEIREEFGDLGPGAERPPQRR